MQRFHLIAMASLLLLASPAQGQLHGNQHGGHTPPSGPYAGFERRPIKALSDQQIADLRAGRGIGLALPAELNGYPGPLHVLEMADALALTGDQRARTRAFLEAMKAETIPLGERIVSAEDSLDLLFAERRVTLGSLSAATALIGTLQGELRAAHLRYHLAMHSLLTADQVARYDQQRGYARP